VGKQCIAVKAKTNAEQLSGQKLQVEGMKAKAQAKAQKHNLH